MPELTPNPDDNGRRWKMEDWKLTDQSADGHTVVYEYQPELTIHKRIYQQAWLDMSIMMNACQGNCQMSFFKKDLTPNETDIFKKKYSLRVVVSSELIEKGKKNA